MHLKKEMKTMSIKKLNLEERKKCPHCSQQFSRLDTKHIKKCEKYSKYIEYGSNRFTCRLCTGSKKSRNRKHIYKLYSHIDEHLSKEVSKENELHNLFYSSLFLPQQYQNNSTKRKKERNLFLPKALLQARH